MISTPARLLLVLLLTAGWWIGAGLRAASANGGDERVREAAVGPYRVSVFTSPSPLRAGMADVSVAVLAPSGEVVPDATVEVIAAPVGQAPIRADATHDRAENSVLYAAYVPLPTPGTWTVTVQVVGPAGGGEVHFGLDVGPLEPYRYIRPPVGSQNGGAPTAASARVWLSGNGSTPRLVVPPDQQAWLLLPAGAMDDARGTGVAVFLTPEAPLSDGAMVLLGNVYAVRAVSLADGRPTPEPWTQEGELSLRVPDGATPDGLAEFADGRWQPVPGSTVGTSVVQARIDRGGRYAVARLGGQQAESANIVVTPAVVLVGLTAAAVFSAVLLSRLHRANRAGPRA